MSNKNIETMSFFPDNMIYKKIRKWYLLHLEIPILQKSKIVGINISNSKLAFCNDL